MLQLQDISVVYKDNKQEFFALKDINLEIEKGRCLAVLGKSGCGKSTLLSIMAGLKKPSEGVVLYKGNVLTKPTEDISVIFQHYELFPWETVRQNLLLPLKLKKQSVDEAYFMQLIQRLGLENQLNKYPAQLSGGQKQRVSIGRAILSQTKLMLMDEPFSALDPKTREEVQVYLKELLMEQKITTVLVTHSIDEAITWGDNIAVFDPGGARIIDVLDNHGSTKATIKLRITDYLVGS
jgi:ABC-type transporter, ATP-binding protein (ATPase)